MGRVLDEDSKPMSLRETAEVAIKSANWSISYYAEQLQLARWELELATAALASLRDE